MTIEKSSEIAGRVAFILRASSAPRENRVQFAHRGHVLQKLARGALDLRGQDAQNAFDLLRFLPASVRRSLLICTIAIGST